MLTEERQSLIERYVNEHELCRVSELCKLTATSESTIRRDLIQMEESGILKRVHGGARSVHNFSRDVSQHVRFTMNHAEKIAIARYAAKKVHPGDYIFIDAGTTTYEMVPFLADVRDVTIVTNGLETALCALSHNIETILIGGRVKADTHASVGAFALQQIATMNFSASFIGVNGINDNGELTTPEAEEAAMKTAEIQHADRAFVLADASKFGQRDFVSFGHASETTIITNKLSKSIKAAIPADIKLEEVI
ncbi:DeoR/GlpR family DNA-binding transcription regulator [Lactobacillus corticis]|uniref:DeoR family transcriptional regulator n=1 Tax=Lactobacillus corticis TaxID=2201249 RepID=A0A916QJF5_9LACO|nr:DeoR/GlpR family DNA-binding transcription regulator [Lactobacillus corticis]GFZ26380.1 DeoR family transcriptional regulator [Lactobacillus corticis]